MTYSKGVCDIICKNDLDWYRLNHYDKKYFIYFGGYSIRIIPEDSKWIVPIINPPLFSKIDLTEGLKRR